MARIVRKIGRITKYETTTYVGSTRILDIDRSSSSDGEREHFDDNSGMTGGVEYQEDQNTDIEEMSILLDSDKKMDGNQGGVSNIYALDISGNYGDDEEDEEDTFVGGMMAVPPPMDTVPAVNTTITVREPPISKVPAPGRGHRPSSVYGLDGESKKNPGAKSGDKK
jgi:hypothetical protein